MASPQLGLVCSPRKPKQTGREGCRGGEGMESLRTKPRLLDSPAASSSSNSCPSPSLLLRQVRRGTGGMATKSKLESGAS
jgi:hypothetical protein